MTASPAFMSVVPTPMMRSPMRRALALPCGGTVSVWPTSTIRGRPFRGARHTTESPCRITSPRLAVARRWVIQSAISCSFPVTLGIFTSCSNNSDSVSVVTGIGILRFGFLPNLAPVAQPRHAVAVAARYL